MSPTANPFVALIRKVRQGDEAAAAELVRRYEPAIRRVVRSGLTDPRMRRVLDSMDICQSVLASFFVRVASGEYDLDTPDQLVGLLVTMARSRLTDRCRQEHAACRDNRVTEDIAGHEPPDPAPGPAQLAEAKDLLAEVHRRLAADERKLVELRNQGHDWAAIAAQVGGTPAALRQKLHRALERVTEQLRGGGGDGE